MVSKRKLLGGTNNIQKLFIRLILGENGKYIKQKVWQYK